MRGPSTFFIGDLPANLGGAAEQDFERVIRETLYGRQDTPRGFVLGRVDANAARLDSLIGGMKARGGPEAAARIDSAIATLKDMVARRDSAGGRRADAFSASAGLHMARQLEYVYAEVLREPFPLQNSFTLFPADTTVPPGARTHTVRRIYADGEAAVYRGGNGGIPRVGLSQQEEQFPVKHYVTSFAYSLFEMLSSQFANTGLVQELLRIARDVIMEFANQKTWYGDAVNGIYGVLNYPWLAKKVVVTAFDGTASPDDVLAELNALANFPSEQSKSTMRPDTVVMSTRLRNYIMNTRLSASDKTIGTFWLESNALGIKNIEDAWELAGVGPGGTDGILFYRRDRRGIANVIPQPFTTLPVQSLAFEDRTFCYMSHGGVIMRDVGNNILAWVDAVA